MRVGSIIYSLAFIILGINSLMRRNKDVQKGNDFHFPKRDYFTYIFYAILPLDSLVSTILNHREYTNLIIGLIIGYLSITLIPIVIMEYSYRKFFKISFTSLKPVDVEGVVEATFLDSGILFDKKDYVGWIDDGIKYDLDTWQQKIYLYLKRPTDRYVYQIHVSNYRREKGQELVERIFEVVHKVNCQEETRKQDQTKYTRNSIITGVIFITVGVIMLWLSL